VDKEVIEDIEKMTGKTIAELEAHSKNISEKYSEYVPVFENVNNLLKFTRHTSSELLLELRQFREVLNHLTEEKDHFDMLDGTYNSCTVHCKNLESFLVSLHDFIFHMEVIKGAISGKGNVMIVTEKDNQE
jgi:hypothetical protein